MQNRKTCVRLTVLAGLLAFVASPVLAERPMAVDDAGTLERGGAKLEFGWSKDDSVRGLEGGGASGPSTTWSSSSGSVGARTVTPRQT